MRAAGEIFAFAVMLVAVGALIAFLDWISSNLADAIDLDLSDTCAWGDVQNVPHEARISGSKDHGCPHDSGANTL